MTVVIWFDIILDTGAVLVMIVWRLDLQLPMQLEPITSKVVSSNPAHDEVYSIPHYVIKFLSDLRRLNVIRENKNAANIWQYFNFALTLQKIKTWNKHVFFSI
jgi:hypothetical protein